MALPDALAAAAEFRRQLLRRELETTARLVRAYAAAHARMRESLVALTADIEVARAAGQVVSPGWLMQQARYQSFLRVCEAEMMQFTASLPGIVGPGTFAALEIGIEEAAALTDAALFGLPPDIRAGLRASWMTPHTGAVKEAMGFLSPGSPVWNSLEGYDLVMRQQIEDVVTHSLMMGYNPKRWADELRLVTGRGLDWAINWTRTLQLNAYREASRRTYLENQNVVKGWWWSSALDNRTCLGCIEMHGTWHPLSEPLNDHHRGRCGPIPDVLSYADLGLTVDEEPFAMRRGEDWFNAQPQSVQMQMMGPGKYDAWKNGLFDFSQLVRQYNDPVWGSMRGETPLKWLVP